MGSHFGQLISCADHNKRVGGDWPCVVSRVLKSQTRRQLIAWVKRVIERNPRLISRARRESQRDGTLNRHRVQDRAVASRLRT